MPSLLSRLSIAGLVLLAACATDRPVNPDAPVRVTAKPVPLDSKDPARTEAGSLAYVGGVVLSSRDPRFGGLSGLRVCEDGWALAVSDNGNWVSFRIVEQDGRPTGIDRVSIAPLLDAQGRPPASKAAADAESVELTDDGVIVTMEVDHRFQVYPGVDPSRPETLRAAPRITSRPAFVADWPRDYGAEAFAAVDGDTDLVLREGADSDGTHPGIVIFDAEAVPFRYRVAAGFDPTDAIRLDDSHVLILHRRYSPLAGAAAMVAVLDMASVEAGRTVAPQEIALIAPPMTVDNMEGIAIRRVGGRIFVYLVSDNNFSNLQRTLLLKFELRR